MKIYVVFGLVVLFAILSLGSSCNKVKNGCDDGETQECFCPDGTTGIQSCRADGNGWDACDCTYYTIWCDPDTDLCWQDPQREAYNYNDDGLISQEAENYCEELVLGGYEDWRLPEVEELRTLIAGNSDTEPGGACPIDDDCTFLESWNLACIGSDVFKGPGVGGCYLKDGLTGTCNKLDPYSAGHYLEVWAKDEASDNERWIASVMFELGAVCFNHICSYGDVRCVRDAPSDPITCEETVPCEPGETRQCTCEGYEQPAGAQVCSDDGSCWGPCECTGHARNPAITPECDNDICPDSDKLELTINLPEGTVLPDKPHMLIAFYYDTDLWEFPPSRPPDGGTDYNQVIDPGMPPYTMTVPACTYYGEYSLEGNHQLYIHLQMVDKFPPIPEGEDYWWGKNESPISFPLDGESHKGTVLKKEITLDPVSCPDDRPIQCADASCVAEPTECPEYSCDPPPNDDNVLSCRYESDMVLENCADFPIPEGWDKSTVQDYCASMDYNPKNIEVVQGYSCLYEIAWEEGVPGCKVEDSTGKDWYIYGMPDFVCTGVMNGTPIGNGPFCESYYTE